MSARTLAEQIADTLDDHTLEAFGVGGGWACRCTRSAAGDRRESWPGDELTSVRRHQAHVAEELAELAEAAA